MLRHGRNIMKILVSICLAAILTATAWADPQPAKSNFTAHTKTSTTHANKEARVIKGSQVTGVLARAGRGNPVQMLNPKAPAKYGNWVQSTSFDPNVPGKWKGIKLFEILF
jgi:hypothetical protein